MPFLQFKRIWCGPFVRQLLPIHGHQGACLACLALSPLLPPRLCTVLAPEYAMLPAATTRLPPRSRGQWPLANPLSLALSPSTLALPPYLCPVIASLPCPRPPCLRT